jgi:hypothetical protein
MVTSLEHRSQPFSLTAQRGNDVRALGSASENIPLVSPRWLLASTPALWFFDSREVPDHVLPNRIDHPFCLSDTEDDIVDGIDHLLILGDFCIGPGPRSVGNHEQVTLSLERF